jgi:GNAT superfamily N-acetyltransferase
MEIIPFREEFLNDAATLFVRNYHEQRHAIPVLPEGMENVLSVAEMLNELFQTCPGVAVVENGELTAYMGWDIVEHFRNADITGAYVPVWAHSAAGKNSAALYRGMYRTASGYWATRGCGVHAISLLASDRSAEKTWFWNGFGLAVVDAIRPILPVDAKLAENLVVRKAQIQDFAAIDVLDREHVRHYSEAPIFMAAIPPESPDASRAILSGPVDSIWLAEFQDEPAGFMSFERRGHGTTKIVESETTIAITNAYTRPQYRGKGIAAAVLDAGLQHYRQLGFERCSVDFESINPEAVNFWMKYFEPVCFSLMRHPEALQQVKIV